MGTTDDDREDLFVALAELLVDINREMRVNVSRTLPVSPLTQTQSQVMRFVHIHPGCAPSEIAEANGLQRTNVSTALRELRDRGYVVAERSRTDGRGIRVHATELADENIAQLRAAWGSQLAAAWDGRDPGALDAALELLDGIRDALTARRATKDFALAAPAARDAS